MIETKKKKLIVCGNCEANGVRSILGELGTTGEFIVQRFHQGETIIKAPVLAILCGNCKSVSYVKNDLRNMGGTVLQYIYEWKL